VRWQCRHCARHGNRSTSDIAFDHINIPSGGKIIPGELYKPSGTAATGLVVIAYGTDDWANPWTQMMQAYAEDLAGAASLR
jgi:hypothetical protein